MGPGASSGSPRPRVLERVTGGSGTISTVIHQCKSSQGTPLAHCCPEVGAVFSVTIEHFAQDTLCLQHLPLLTPSYSLGLTQDTLP